MHREKIIDALNSAVIHLDTSMRALAQNKDEKAFANSLWLASSETEYALFQFSLMHSEKSESSSLKQSPQTKQIVEVGPALSSAQNLLKEARSKIEAGSTGDAHEETLNARYLLLKAQEVFEKKLKSATAQPSRTR